MARNWLMEGSASSMKVEGLAELKDLLKQLPAKAAGRALTAATMAGAEIIRKQAIANIVANGSVGTGRLRDNIIKRRVRGSKGDTGKSVSVVVGPRVPKVGGRNHPNNAFYGRFVEDGTSKMEARPWLRPAFDQQKEAAANAIKERLAKRIEKEAIKLAAASRRRLA